MEGCLQIKLWKQRTLTPTCPLLKGTQPLWFLVPVSLHQVFAQPGLFVRQLLIAAKLRIETYPHLKFNFGKYWEKVTSDFRGFFHSIHLNGCTSVDLNFLLDVKSVSLKYIYLQGLKHINCSIKLLMKFYGVKWKLNNTRLVQLIW